MIETVGVIPVRYRSTRFPGKALATLSGRPLVQHVYDRCLGARSLERVVVATDDRRILEAVAGFGGEALLTSSEHPSGTDRLAEVARLIEAGIYVNIQGDEPLVEPQDIDALVAALQANGEVDVATLREPISGPEDRENPNVVKVVTDTRGDALYFSRAPIPYGREGKPVDSFRHVGLYAYRRKALLEFASSPPSPLEVSEQLEQLRVLEMGRRIRVLSAQGRSVSVDTPEDLRRVQKLLDDVPS